ncbi:MAG: hypothetical protein QOD90_4071, partial [Mycobacterium sp.]|nr:hypothetical protein [Mycobacterium sp.]
MTETADVVIVGGGIEGAAAAWALAQRGVTDVLVVERNTVGSGMTGKSSGIVRCHYGVSSLAAMANVGLEVFENAEEVFGHDIGFRQTGYVVGVGERNVDALRKSLAAQRAVGVQTDEIDAAEVAEMWPHADLEPFAAFAHEARGGFGDAYQTAQAFAVAARGAGVRVRQGTAVTDLLLDGDRVTGVRLADGTEVDAGTVVIATGVWTRNLLLRYGIDMPIRVVLEQIVMIAPGVELGPVPVFSDLVSLQYIRPEPGGEVLFGNSDLSHVQDADPDDYPNRATEDFVDVTIDRVSTRFPGFTDAAITGGYAGCYDVTPDWNPVISRTGIDGLVVAAGFSGHGFKIAPAVGRLIAD